MPGADTAQLQQAVDYASRNHEPQKRKDGSPYIIHPLAVAKIVAEMGLDMDAVLGALLHDCCALAHAMDLDAETALRAATGRQIERLRTENP